MKPIAIVGGAIANKYRNGGEAWVRLSWAVGLRRLGFDVWLFEQISPAVCRDDAGQVTDFETSANLAYFRQTMRAFGLERNAVLMQAGPDAEQPSAIDGLHWQGMQDVARRADLLINVSGHLTLPSLLDCIRRKIYIDIDPGFTQFWHDDPTCGYRVGGHDFYFTIGRNIGSADCPIPTGAIPWRHVNQPVVLDDWPVTRAADQNRFTTVASWRGAFGTVYAGGRSYGLKVHEFRKVLPLPQRVREHADTGCTFEIALDIHPGDDKDRAALQGHGWVISDPQVAAGSPEVFRQFIRNSGAEFSCAQGIYVDTNSGWFSDRTIRYLASGKPALVQETGFSRHLPSGMGLVSFRTLEEAQEGALRITRNYAAHSVAARRIAEDHFDSDKVLVRLLEETGIG